MPGVYQQQRNLKQLHILFSFFIFLFSFFLIMTALKKEVFYAMTCQAGLPDGYDVYLNQKNKPNHLRKTHVCTNK